MLMNEDDDDDRDNTFGFCNYLAFDGVNRNSPRAFSRVDLLDSSAVSDDARGAGTGM